MKMPNFQAQNGPLAPNDIFFQKQWLEHIQSYKDISFSSPKLTDFFENMLQCIFDLTIALLPSWCKIRNKSLQKVSIKLEVCEWPIKNMAKIYFQTGCPEDPFSCFYTDTDNGVSVFSVGMVPMCFCCIRLFSFDSSSKCVVTKLVYNIGRGYTVQIVALHFTLF